MNAEKDNEEKYPVKLKIIYQAERTNNCSNSSKSNGSQLMTPSMFFLRQQHSIGGVESLENMSARGFDAYTRMFTT